MKPIEKRREEIFESFPELREIPQEKYPQHILIIPDGNRRYAKRKGKPEVWGHREGFKVAIKLLRYFRPLPIKTVTLWGFASDNWKRERKEIENLMTIFGYILDNYIEELHENNSRFIHLGRRDRLPIKLLGKITAAEEKTKHNNGQIICLALDFGGEDQNIRSMEKARKLPKDEHIDISTLWKLRDSKGLVKSADLIIRTAESRTSDVGWINGSHTVLFFLTDKLFPEISEQDFADSLVYYANTKRNEGA